MKCPLCQERKGKRLCKINAGQSICPICCATVRATACEGCSHYGPCLAYQREKQVSQKHFLVEMLPEVDEHCDAALALAEQGQLAQAEAALEVIRQQHPAYHMVWYGVGACHALRGEIDQAIACFERAVEIFPLLAQAHYNLGVAYMQKVNIEKAVRAFETAIAVDGRDGQIGSSARKRLDTLEAMVNSHNGVSMATFLDNLRAFDQGFAALRDGHYRLAIDLFTRVLKTDKKHVQSYGNIGLAYGCLGNLEKALEYLDKALDIDPEYEPAIVNRLALANLAEGDALHGIAGREISYYSEFRARKQSYLQHLAGESAAERTPGTLGTDSFNGEAHKGGEVRAQLKP